MKFLLVGSLAYDTVMTYNGLFQDMMVVGNTNLALVTDQKKVRYGGCSGNIGYSLKLLGADSLLFTVAGKDFDEYLQRLQELGIDASSVHVSEKDYTASATIVSDSKNNQITLFHPGAMYSVDMTEKITDLPVKDFSWAIISPDLPARMVRSAQECREAGLKYIFDPGQALGKMSAEGLFQAVKGADILIGNDYEMALISQMLKVPKEDFVLLVPVVIETMGEQGSQIFTKDEATYVKTLHLNHVAEPTGAGDAYRAGLLFGLGRGFSFEKSAKIGTLLACYCIEMLGTQEHHFEFGDFQKRFLESFGEEL